MPASSKPFIVCLLVLIACGPSFVLADSNNRAPQDLQLSYQSAIDGTTQHYRLFLPSAYDKNKPLPLLVALHGTGGSQNTYATDYHNGIYFKEAEKRGIAIVCPHGRGTTEYRGLGENDVLTVIEEVCQNYQIDRDRIICSGQSMGGTGATYLCCRYPDLFAAGIPLASTYEQLTLIENLLHVPMLYIQGADDWPVYAATGPTLIAQRLNELGYAGRLWMVDGAKHNTMDQTTSEVIDWALKQERVAHPRRVLFRAYLPCQGRAYWTEITDITEPGRYAEIDATIKADNLIDVSLRNVNAITLRPDAELLDLTRPVRIMINGRFAFKGMCSDKQEVRIGRIDSQWAGNVHSKSIRPYTAFRTQKIAVAKNPPAQPQRWDTSGVTIVNVPQTRTNPAETTMGSWMADAMRSAVNADIALYSRSVYRGVPLKDSQTVHAIDLFDWLRPFNCGLGTFEVTGKTLLEIIEENIRNAPDQDRFLLQVSGCRYSFDRNHDKGSRIVETDIIPEERYSVVCETHMLDRGDTCHLGQYGGKLAYVESEFSNISVAWRYAIENNGILSGIRDGRIQDVTPAP